MAATAKMATRALRATPLASSMRPAARRVAIPRQAFQRQARRGYASEAPKPSGGSNTALIGGIAAIALAGLGYYATSGTPESLKQGSAAQGQQGSATFSPSREDYQKVYDFIAKKLIDEDDYDDGINNAWLPANTTVHQTASTVILKGHRGDTIEEYEKYVEGKKR